MRGKASSFSEEMLRFLEESLMSLEEISEKSGLSYTTVYRHVYAKSKYIAGDTAKRMAQAIGKRAVIWNGEMHLVETEEEQRKEEREAQNLELEEKDRQEKIKGVVVMLKKINSDQLDLANRIIALLMEMDDEELKKIEFIVENAKRKESREKMLERLRAVITLVMPFSEEKEKGEIYEG